MIRKIAAVFILLVLTLTFAVYADDNPSSVVSNFLSTMEFGTNDDFTAYLAPSSDGMESDFETAGWAMKAEFASHQNGYEIIGE